MLLPTSGPPHGSGFETNAYPASKTALAAELLVVALLDRLDRRREALLVRADHHEHAEVVRVNVGVREHAGAREVLLDVGLVRVWLETCLKMM